MTSHVYSELCYWVLVILFALLVRVVTSLLNAFERPSDWSFHKTVACVFLGKGVSTNSNNKHGEHAPDYWYPFIIGIFELAIYPAFMATGNWQAVGGWLAFKTVSQWKRWAEHRPSANRFIIGNALVLGISFLILKPLF